MLPRMIYGDGIQKYKQTSFGGYNHTLGAGNGDLWDMENLTSDFAPVLSPRLPRYLIRTMEKPNGMHAKDGLFWADGTGFYADGALKGTVTDSKKQFCSIGAYVIILPDKKYYNRLTDTFGSLEAYWSGSAKIQDGTFAGEAAEANTIEAVGAGALFKEGDAVTIGGCTIHEENNKTIIIREIDGDYLRFYENSFTIGAGGETENLTLSRTIPALDYICENENRLWGVSNTEENKVWDGTKFKTVYTRAIYACKQGDPFNWNVFDGLSTDSFAVSEAGAGNFTGCCKYLGYPCFFKEESISKMYGDKPSNFQLMASASLGVEEGSGGSLAIAGEMLFYLSRIGVVVYTGGTAQSIADAFGTERYKNAIAGSDGVKYYISMEDTKGEHHLFVYDTRKRMWHKEDNTRAAGFGWNRELYILDEDGNLWMNGNAREAPEGAEKETFEWMAQWADITEYTSYNRSSTPMPEKKHIGKILLRLELDEGASMSIYMQFDSGGTWEKVKDLTAAKKRSYYLPIIPRRCDHFSIKITGTGDCKLYSLVREVSGGSEN